MFRFSYTYAVGKILGVLAAVDILMGGNFPQILVVLKGNYNGSA